MGASRGIWGRLGLLAGLAAALFLIYQVQTLFGSLRTLGGPSALEPIAHEDASALAFTPDGKTLISADLHGRVRRWDLVTGAYREKSLVGLGIYRSDLRSVALSRSGELCVASAGNAVYALDLVAGRSARPLWGVTEARPSDGGRFLAAIGPRGRSASVFRADGRLVARAVLPERGRLRSVEVSDDGRWLAALTREWDRQGKLWVVDLTAAAPRLIREGVPGGQAAIRFSPGGQVLALRSEAAPGVQTWEAAAWAPRSTVPFGEGSAPFRFSADGGRLAAAARVERDYLIGSLGLERRREKVDALQVLDLTGGGAAFRWDPSEARGHHGRVRDCVLSPDGETAATLDREGRIALWDVKRGRFLRFLRG